MQVSIKLENLDISQDHIEQAMKKIKDTKPLMLELGNHLYNISLDSFEHEKDPNGNPWTPLKASTLENKSTSKMLYDEGTMQNNLINKSSSNEVAVGIGATFNGYLYPAVQQFGTKDGKVEDRAFMPINKDMNLYSEVEGELEEIVIEFIEEAIS